MTPRERLEEMRHPVDLVEDDQFILMQPQELGGLRELVPVGHGLEIEIDGRSRRADLQRQSGLADLTRADQRHGRFAVERLEQIGQFRPGNHPCNIKPTVSICNEKIILLSARHHVGRVPIGTGLYLRWRVDGACAVACLRLR